MGRANGNAWATFLRLTFPRAKLRRQIFMTRVLQTPRPATEPRNPETPKVHFKVREMPFSTLKCTFGVSGFRGSVAGRGVCKTPSHSLGEELGEIFCAFSCFICCAEWPTNLLPKFLPIYHSMSCGWNYKISSPRASGVWGPQHFVQFLQSSVCFLTVSSRPCLETSPHSTLRTPFAGHCLGALWGGKPCPAELSEGVNRVLRTLSGDPPLPILQTPSAGHCLDTHGFLSQGKVTFAKSRLALADTFVAAQNMSKHPVTRSGTLAVKAKDLSKKSVVLVKRKHGFTKTISWTENHGKLRRRAFPFESKLLPAVLLLFRN